MNVFKKRSNNIILYFLLKYRWNKICWFQVYYIMVSCLHTLWSDHHDKSNNHLSPYKVFTILLTVFLMLHIISCRLMYHITGGLYLLILFNYFTYLHPPPFWQPPICSMYLLVYFHFVYLFSFLNSTYPLDHGVFVFSCLTYLI